MSYWTSKDPGTYVGPSLYHKPNNGWSSGEFSPGGTPEIITQYDAGGTKYNSSGEFVLAPPIRDLALIERWVPSDLTLMPEKFKISTTNGTLSANEYELYYTTDERSVANPTWVLSQDYTGDIAAVSGYKIVYTGNGRMFDQAIMRVVSKFHTIATRPLDTPSGVQHPIPVDGQYAYDGVVKLTKTIQGRLTTGHFTLEITGTGYTAYGTPTALLAGERARYTLKLRVWGTHGTPFDQAPKNLTIPNGTITLCLPEQLLVDTLDFSMMPKEWELKDVAAESCNSNGGTGNGTLVTLKYRGAWPWSAEWVANAVFFTARTSHVAPESGTLVTTGEATAWLSDPASIKNVLPIVQPSVAQYDQTTKHPVIDRGQTADFDITWFNFLGSSRGSSSLVTVLPYNGDPRGTNVTGPVTLNSAEISAKAEQGAELELTTDPSVRGSKHATAPADDFTWISYDQATPEQIAAATALRVSITDFIAGNDSVGTLRIKLDAPNARNGDVLRNTVSAALAHSDSLLAEAAPVQVKILTDTVAGSVWSDEDGDGKQGAKETPLAGAEVQLMQGATVVETTTTDADGAYAFETTPSASYTLAVVKDSLPATTGEWLLTTPAAEEEFVSGVTEPRDFGFRNQLPALTVGVTGTAPKTVAAGETVKWEATIVNTGNTGLTDVDLAGTLAGFTIAADPTWPNSAAPGVLAAGESVKVAATSSLTQAQIDAGVVKAPVTAVGSSDVPNRVNTASAEGSVKLSNSPTLDITIDAALDNGGNTVRPGDTVNVDVEVTNTGNTSITDTDITSTTKGLSAITIGGWPGDEKVLLPGESALGAATILVTQKDIDAGKITIDAKTSGTTLQGEAVSDSASTTVSLTGVPAATLTMSATLDPAKAEIGYTLTATNTGNQTLENVTLSHDLASKVNVTWPGKTGVLAPGEVATATAVVPVTKAMRDTTVSATGATSGTTAQGVTVRDSAVTQTPVPAIVTGLVWDDVNGNGVRDAGEPPLAGVSVELLQNSKVVETVKTGKDGVYSFAGIYVDEYSLRVVESSLPETTGEWLDTSLDFGVPTGSGGRHDFGFRNQLPALSLQVEGDAPETVTPGELVTWDVTLTNSGNTDLSMIELASELEGLDDYEYVEIPDPGAMNHLAPGASLQLRATLPLTQALIDAGEVTNPVAASGYSQVPDRINAVAEEGVVTLAVTPRLGLSVGGALDNDADTTRPGDKVTVEIVITNTGNQTITGAEITSPNDGISDITIDGWPGVEKVLLPGESVTGTATVTVTQDDIDAGKVNVVAVTNGTSPKGSPVTQDGSTTVDLVGAPTIALEMTSELDPAGDAILYSLSSTNTGNQTLENVTLSHSLASELTVAWPGKADILAPGETATVELRVPLTDAMRGTDVLATALSEGATRLGVAVNAAADVSSAVPATPTDKTPQPQKPTAPQGIVPEVQGWLAITGATGGAIGVGILGSTMLIAGAILLIQRRRQKA